MPRAFQPDLVLSNRRAIGGYCPRLPRSLPRPHGNREALLATGGGEANRLDMSYEARLARRALGEAGGGLRRREGFPS